MRRNEYDRLTRYRPFYQKNMELIANELQNVHRYYFHQQGDQNKVPGVLQEFIDTETKPYRWIELTQETRFMPTVFEPLLQLNRCWIVNFDDPSQLLRIVCSDVNLYDKLPGVFCELT
jgi:hypothetical protein